MTCRTILLLFASLLCTLPSEAQILTGNFIGVVRDESRAVLPGVTVTLGSPARPAGPATAVTNAQGEYRITALEPGVYELTVTLTGFTKYQERDLRVAVGGTTERNVTLSVGSVSESITVSGQAPVVDPRQTGLSATLTKETVENVPHSRIHVAGLMATLPGVSPGNYNRISALSVMGSAGNEVSYMQDGILSNSMKSGSSYSNMEGDGAQEIQAVTLGASVEYQQAQGGVLNVVGKTGTNRFQGDGTAFWQPHNWTSTPITLPCNCPLGSTGFKWYSHQDYSFHAGGPIVKDRLWFFSGATNFGINQRNPGAPDTPEALRWNRYNIRTNTKGTWKINDKLSFQQVFYYDWWEYTLPEFPTRTTPLEAIDWYVGEIRDGASELTATLSPTTFLTARYVVHYMPEGNIGFGPQYTRNDITTPQRFDNFTGLTSGNFSPSTISQPRRDDVNVKVNRYISGDRVNHNVRFGVQFSRASSLEGSVVPSGVRYLDLNGQPDQAEFTPPASFAATARSTGFWAEDELNIGHRLTLVPGLRFDHMKAGSPDAPIIDGTSLVQHGGTWAPYYSFSESAGTIAGLGDLYTWNKVSPRLGVNLKLGHDDKTVLRGTVGRYYRPLFLNDYLNVHPGIAPTTLTRYNPATAAYSTVISVTDPRANVAVDPNTQAPWTDQYSVGIDRELMRNLGFSVSVVHKEWGDQIGWVDTGGLYGTQTADTPAGPMTVFPLLNATSARKYLRTNPAGWFNRYSGLMLQLNRRFANRWMGSVGYSYSVTNGLQVAGTSTTGRDPNDLINLTGRQTPQDRPHMFNVSGMYHVPKIDVQVSGNLQLSSGLPYGPQIQVRLPQGLRSVYYDAPGSYRTPFEQWLHLRIGKSLLQRGSHRIELAAELRNALDETSIANLITQVAASPNFGLPASWAYPRRLAIMTKVVF
jgi:hypothetical protein